MKVKWLGHSSFLITADNGIQNNYEMGVESEN